MPPADTLTERFGRDGNEMRLRTWKWLASVVAGLVATVTLPAITLANPALTDPDGRLLGGAPENVKVKGLFEILALRRQEVGFETKEKPGTIIVFTAQRKLYYVLGNNRAIQYGVGVGRDGFTWNGIHTVSAKREWPDWRPPPEMLKRQPGLPRHMKGGPGNPLGARAMYIGSTIYRIHGTHDPDSVGEADSSGCIRLTNDDVIDLYNRVKVGAKVIVVK
jgi:lipoprotein-anchoring transpeptidase ErfK/SrfK